MDLLRALGLVGVFDYAKREGRRLALGRRN